MTCPCTPQTGDLRQVLRGPHGNQAVITQRYSNAHGAWVEISAVPVH